MSLFYISISGKSMKRLRYNSEPKREETKSVPESVVVAVSERRAGQGAEQKNEWQMCRSFWIASSRSSKRGWSGSNLKRILFNVLFEFAIWKIRTAIKLPIFPIAQHKFSTTSWANSLLYFLLHFINIFDMLIFCYGRIVF